MDSVGVRGGRLNGTCVLRGEAIVGAGIADFAIRTLCVREAAAGNRTVRVRELLIALFLKIFNHVWRDVIATYAEFLAAELAEVLDHSALKSALASCLLCQWFLRRRDTGVFAVGVAIAAFGAH